MRTRQVITQVTDNLHVTCMGFVGVILDEKLTWREHIEERVKKAVKVREELGFESFGVVLDVYRARVRPIIATVACSGHTR